MKKLAKTITALLLAGTTLSLMCGCDNGVADDKNSSVSGGNSATQSTASDKSDTSSKDESKPDETSDPDYERMMELVNQLSTESTPKDVYNILGKPDKSIGSGVTSDTYYFGRYKVQTVFTNGLELTIIDTKTDKCTTILYPTKPINPYDENSSYSKEVTEVVNKVSSLSSNSKREEVIKLLGEPDEANNYGGIQMDKYNFETYTIWVTYPHDEMLLEIRENDNFETIDIIYPDEYKNQ